MGREGYGEAGAPYELLFEQNPNPMWVVDRATLRFVSVNAAAVARYGYSREEFLAMTLRDIRPPEEQARLNEWLTRPAQGPSGPAVGQHRAKDGSIFDVEVYATRFETPDGPRTLACAIDVSARNRAEATARAAERRLQMLIEKQFEGMSLNDANGVTQYVTPAITRMLGYERSEVIGQSGATWVHPEDVERERGAFRRMMQTPGATHTAVMRNRHKDGSWRWLESTTTNLLHDPEVRAMVAVFRDVTDRKEFEEALRRSEKSFRALLDHLPTGVIVHRAGRVVYANRTLAALVQRDDGELHGTSIFELIPEDEHDPVRTRIDQLATAPTSYNPPRTGELLRRDGTRLEVEIEALHVDFDGEPANLVLFRDLSERRELLSRMALADRMRSVGMLAAGVAHEINNPLAYVLTNLALLGEELHGPVGRLRASDVEQLIRDASDGATRVRDVVRDLRMLSRADDAAIGAVDLRSVLASCAKMAGNEIRFRARLVIDAEPLPKVRGTEGRLGQLFLNLLINAAHAIPEGHAEENEVRVRARRSGDRVVVEVSDTGCGIPPAILGRIFDPFFTTKPAGMGTGLGLAICHGIVKALGGNIEVESTPGRGSTFRVTLPEAVEQERRTVSGERAIVTRRGRILVVDDEPAIGTTLRLMLQGEHDVVTVTRARDALERIRAGESFDVVLCDVMMPELSGIELYAAVAHDKPDLATKFVFLTGGAFTDNAREFLERNANPQIEKPFAMDVLRKTIGRMVDAA